jgi:hypothetical protein
MPDLLSDIILEIQCQPLVQAGEKVWQKTHEIIFSAIAVDCQMSSSVDL